ncbi:WecB/TagA/CpsF family glycosyltransferase [Rhodoferax sp. AJA081-3]|uniref:WecB/TagA/CpsF family glycosyltransferase n=1 Tax=Rhodoferax sp. AJA081-3 TaxID=2752316 RepID=UPI001ADF307D|nr:WecB/TagA/CpsF family glycosyltransferase [Rhodoferax sp. AJA081-3]QTN26850.1 WecB/TagA/CpsF family glycosyltransferase [Rhodoferax sp. AJA081-3]
MKSTIPNSERNVHCVLGLPFDAVSLEQAVESIRDAITRRAPCFISTPNLNFLIAGHTNAAFRNSVGRSDLSLADGMPIVWLAKLMGIPITQRVSGSDVFEALRQGVGPLLKVYFFGGPPGVAQRAAQQINTEGKGMVCVGFESPGYGTIEEMSRADTIAKINQSGADFLIVALGAVKGQSWIESNLEALQVPVVSHLGAVVNFVAGGVRRAPHWMQTTGLEWAWRIREEPTLWKRYLSDGKGLIKLLATRVTPFLYYKYLHRESAMRAIEVTIEWDNSEPTNIQLQGDDTLRCGAWLKNQLTQVSPGFKKLTVRLIELSWIPSDLLGMIQVIDSHGYITLQVLVDNVKPCALQQLSLSGCRYVSVHI